MPHLGQSTHESAPPLKRTPPYSYYGRGPRDKSTASPAVARQKRARKHPLQGQENLHYLGATQQP